MELTGTLRIIDTQYQLRGRFPMKRVLPLLLILLITPLASAAQDERLQVVASFSILEDVVQVVAGDAADVSTLIPVGADPHTFEPTPRDLTAIADADVVFTNGAFFEEGLLASIENASSDVNIVESSACVPAIAFDGDHHHGHEHGDEDHDHADEDHDHADEDHDHGDEDHDHADEDHDHADEDHDHADEDHDHSMDNPAAFVDMTALCTRHASDLDGFIAAEGALGPLFSAECEGGSCDPHVWTVPTNVMYWTLMVRDTLSDLDPDNAAIYAANADAYLAELETLEVEIRTAIESVAPENRVLVTNHEAFGYFAATYGFEVVSAILPGGGTAADPSASEIAGVIDTVNAESVPAIFTETTVRDEIAQQIASETGAEIFLLYSGSLGDADSPAATYLDYMRYNVTTIVDALTHN
jgi:zinc/manganese transport system substrate-binding protein